MCRCRAPEPAGSTRPAAVHFETHCTVELPLIDQVRSRRVRLSMKVPFVSHIPFKATHNHRATTTATLAIVVPPEAAPRVRLSPYEIWPGRERQERRDRQRAH